MLRRLDKNDFKIIELDNDDNGIHVMVNFKDELDLKKIAGVTFTDSKGLALITNFNEEDIMTSYGNITHTANFVYERTSVPTDMEEYASFKCDCFKITPGTFEFYLIPQDYFYEDIDHEMVMSNGIPGQFDDSKLEDLKQNLVFLIEE